MIVIKISLVIVIIAGVSFLLYLFSGLLDLTLCNIHYKDNVFGNTLQCIENINDIMLLFSNLVFKVSIGILGVEVIVAAVIYLIYITVGCIKIL